MTVGTYDDGRAEVPGGVTGPVERVAVVGAGIAGLTVANALTHAGVDCVVLEARDRIGGRLHTVDLAGAPVDMGGSWIHHPAGNPLRAFAEQVGVVCRPGNPLAALAGYDCGEGRRLSRSEVDESLALQFDDFPDAVGRLGSDRGPDASAADAIDTFVAGAGLAPGPAETSTPGSARGRRGRCGRSARKPVVALAVERDRVRRGLLRRPPGAGLSRPGGRDGRGARRTPGCRRGRGRAVRGRRAGPIHRRPGSRMPRTSW